MSLSEDLLFAPGVARPDRSGCWDGEFTFEHCCVPWERAQVGIGNSGCWSGVYTYKHCCEPTDIPRKLFSCEELGDDWAMFRRDMMLGKALRHAQVKGIAKKGRGECLLGHFVATLSLLVLAIGESEQMFVAAYERAADVVRVVLRSPVSIAEIFASGWPIGAIFSTLRYMPRIFDYAYSLVKDFVREPSHPAWIGAREDIITKIISGHRVDPGHTVALLSASLFEGRMRTYQDCLDSVMASWNIALSLRNFDGPRAPREEWTEISRHVNGLLNLGMGSLIKAIVGHNPIDTTSPKFDVGIPDGDPLAVIMSMHHPLLEVMSAFQYDPVVAVDPNSLTHNTVHSRGLVRRELQLHGLPPMEMHILPQYDAVSNNIRTSGQPFCYDAALLSIVALLSCKGNCQSNTSETSYCCDAASIPSDGVLQLWEVGASLGDCTLWANTVLHHGYSGIRSQSIAFEPLPHVAAALRRSASALLKKNLVSQQASGKIPQYTFLPEISVHEIAVGAHAGTIPLGIPPDSIAQATFYDCEKEKLDNSTDSTPCNSVLVQIETVDRLLQQHSGTVDYLKIHVQGAEMDVLKGARQSLLSGRICVVTLYLHVVALGAGRSFELGRELYDTLSGYLIVLLDRDSNREFFVSPRKLGRIIAGLRKKWNRQGADLWDSKGRLIYDNPDRQLVAVREDSGCSRSPAVVAAQVLWGRA